MHCNLNVPIDMTPREVFMLLYVKWQRHRFHEDSREYCPHCKALGLSVFAVSRRPVSFSCGNCGFGVRRQKQGQSYHYEMRAPSGRWCENVPATQFDNYYHTLQGGHYNALLNEESVREIRTMHEAGVRYRDLAALYEVSYHTIRDVCDRRNWKHVR